MRSFKIIGNGITQQATYLPLSHLVSVSTYHTVSNILDLSLFTIRTTPSSASARW